MLEEGTNQGAVIGDGLQLVVNSALQLFACFQGRASNPCALGMTPDQLVGIEVRRIAGQEVQGELASGAGDNSFTIAFLCAGSPSTIRRTGFLRFRINCLSNSTNNSPVNAPE